MCDYYITNNDDGDGTVINCANVYIFCSPNNNDKNVINNINEVNDIYKDKMNNWDNGDHGWQW